MKDRCARCLIAFDTEELPIRVSLFAGNPFVNMCHTCLMNEYSLRASEYQCHHRFYAPDIHPHTQYEYDQIAAARRAQYPDDSTIF